MAVKTEGLGNVSHPIVTGLPAGVPFCLFVVLVELLTGKS